jgi:Fe-coproporphyrin III synthase
MYELKIVRDYRDGKVSKESLDKLSTCDMSCLANNGLRSSNSVKEEIVSND